MDKAGYYTNHNKKTFSSQYLKIRKKGLSQGQQNTINYHQQSILTAIEYALLSTLYQTQLTKKPESATRNTMIHNLFQDQKYPLFVEFLKSVLKSYGYEKSVRTRFNKQNSHLSEEQRQKVRDLVGKIEQSSIGNLHTFAEGNKPTINASMKQAFFSLLLDELGNSNNDIDGAIGNLTKCFAIIHDIYNNKDITVYFSQYDDHKVLYSTILEGVKEGKLSLSVLTCPDYSGHVNHEGKREFDFNRLGTGCGVVTEKSFAMTQAVYNAFKNNCPDGKISINHYLPTFEFDQQTGFSGGEEQISYRECVSRLLESLQAIAGKYESIGIPNANVGLSRDVVSDDDFLKQKREKYDVLRKKCSEDPIFSGVVDKTLKQRRPLYTKWYPKDSDETDEQYIDKLRDKLLLQAAEYMIMGEYFTGEGEILIASDSRPMRDLTGYLGGYPVLYGQSNTATDYTGA